MHTTGFDLFSGTPLLVLAVFLLVIGAALVAAPFVGVGARRRPAIEAEIVWDAAPVEGSAGGPSAGVSAFRAAHRGIAQ